MAHGHHWAAQSSGSSPLFRLTPGNQLDDSFSYEVRVSRDHGQVIFNTIGHFRRATLVNPNTDFLNGTTQSQDVLIETVEQGGSNVV
jgi:hypothetical protein